MSKGNLVLDYASQPIAAPVKFPTVVRLIVLLFILPALVLPFVGHPNWPSPLQALAVAFQREWMGDHKQMICFYTMVLSGFVGIPLVLCHLRVLIFGELSRIEVWAGYVVAFLGMASVATCLSLFANHLLSSLDQRVRSLWPIVHLSMPTVAIAFGTFVVWSLGKRISHSTRICAGLSITYAASLLLWVMACSGFQQNLMAFIHVRTFSHALTLLVIVGTLVEITTLAVVAFRWRGK
ncbi:MAG: hypothetical protein FWD61_15235 [Phycisphaerales bacterium]|nr:hypothetical protein [Phycisphaerales bacterium]